MIASTRDFSLDAEGINGTCPAGEANAKQNIADQRIPIISCEGPCIRGEIARLAANIVAQKVPLLARSYNRWLFSRVPRTGIEVSA